MSMDGIRRKRAARIALIAGGAVCVVALAVWGVRLALIARSLRAHLAQAQALADASAAPDAAAACGLARDLRGDVVALEGLVAAPAQLAPALGWLPGIGGDLRAAPHLLETADGLTEAGALACDALEPGLTALSGGDESSGGVSPGAIATLLAEQQGPLEQALAAVERAQAAWARVDQDSLSPRLADKAGLLDRALPLLRAGLAGAAAAPDLLGVDGSRTYLILAMNEDEQRPVMGYITGVGEARVEAGRVISMTFRDGYAVDDFTQPYPDPPEPARRYMGIDLWVFRDSNWSPDFPTSARQAIALYRPGYPVSVDGLVALDQYAVQQIVAALGPLEVEGVEEPVTGGTVVAYMRQAWAPEEGERLNAAWWRQRKAFMGSLARAAWGRVEGGQVDWVAFARTLYRLLEEKHLLIYLERPEAAAALSDLGWDGALRSRPGDFLMVVDTNVGYNRASARIRQEAVYQVDLSAAPPQASLTLVYTHTGAVDYRCVPEIRYDPVYEQMMDRCYWDYLQVYAPRGSDLLDATRIPVPGEALWSGVGESGEMAVAPAPEGPWTVFSALALLPPGATQSRTITWTLPPDVVQWQGDEGVYALWVQKQAGSRGYPLTVRVRLPEGSELVEAGPGSWTAAGDWVVYRTILERDLEARLRFGR